MNRYLKFGALILLVCCLALARPAYASKPAPTVTIAIDDSVVTRLLAMIAGHDDSDASINSWMDMAGNKELLSVGESEGQLTRDQLRDNVKAVVDGAATDTTQPKYAFGRIIMSPASDYQKMIDDLHANESALLDRCSARDASFAPQRVTVNQTVYLQLGGDWDAINRDGAIYINMHFFHDYFTPSWSGLDLLIAHETFHAVQNMAFGNPEATDNSDDAFYTAVSKIQREGMARYVEVETDPQGYPEGTYGFYFRAIDEESLRSFNGFMPLLGRLASACYPALNQQAYSDAVTDGLNSGGPYYAIGEGMAQAIDRYAGRNRLVETVSKGPLDFFDCYIGIAHSHNELPQVPTEVVSHIETLRHKYRNGRLPLPVAGASTSFGAATPAHHY